MRPGDCCSAAALWRNSGRCHVMSVGGRPRGGGGLQQFTYRLVLAAADPGAVVGGVCWRRLKPAQELRRGDASCPREQDDGRRGRRPLASEATRLDGVPSTSSQSALQRFDERGGSVVGQNAAEKCRREHGARSRLQTITPRGHETNAGDTTRAQGRGTNQAMQQELSDTFDGPLGQASCCVGQEAPCR